MVIATTVREVASGIQARVPLIPDISFSFISLWKLPSVLNLSIVVGNENIPADIGSQTCLYLESPGRVHCFGFQRIVPLPSLDESNLDVGICKTLPDDSVVQKSLRNLA